MIKNIIFDMGQVLLKFDPDFFIARAGISDKEDIELLKRSIYKSVEWSRMDRGSLIEKEAMRIFCHRLPERLHDVAFDLCCDWHNPIIPIQGAIEVLEKLKKAGYKLYLLSNASLMQKDYWKRFKAHDLFDGRVVSSEVGFVKPQPEIYQYLLKQYDLIPDECVFIDDSQANCEGAYYCGIHPIVFHGDYDEVYEEFKKLDINI